MEQDTLVNFVAYVLSCMGLTVLIVWPADGPGALVRDRLLRRMAPRVLGPLLDCYVCCSVWCALALSPLWWSVVARFWCWSGPLICPALFWLLLHAESQHSVDDC